MSKRKLTPEELRQLRLDVLASGQSPKLIEVIERNIDTLVEVRRQIARARGPQDRLADAITAWSGSMPFVFVHAAWFAGWVVSNLGWFGPRWMFDPFPFGLLTMIVSLEAIFLATFVLLSQNRQAEVAEQRAELDLQINLLSEYELTRVLKLVDAIADHLGLAEGRDPELEDLKRDVSPEAVIREMDRRKHVLDRESGRD
ncbi:DUF1003 domain-containing protein [Tundrisphaera lichenicola]|uniref:DUF1003 domain-containing protein n=1 Tax=Tundrisphaera lichenicola TaxID=2029860 RepID=UPI003EBBD787